jgi:type II secretory pathway pseudopilin PulG
MADKKGNSGETLKVVIMVILVALVILGIYMALIVRGGKNQSDEETSLLTEVQQITTMNLDENYPNSERDVVSLFGRITKALYGETYTDEEFSQMASQLEKLYDPELLAQQNGYESSLKDEVQQKKNDYYTVQNYVVADKDEIVYKKIDGKECASLDCLFAMRQNTEMATINYVFILRKSDDGRWKILGWTVKPEDGASVGSAPIN